MVKVTSNFIGTTIDEAAIYTVNTATMTINSLGITNSFVSDTDTVNSSDEKLANFKRAVDENRIATSDSFSREWRAVVSSSLQIGIGEKYYRSTDTHLSDSINVFNTSNKIATAKHMEAEDIRAYPKIYKFYGKRVFDTEINGATMRPQSFFDRLFKEILESLETPLKSIYGRFKDFVGFSDSETWDFDKIYNDNLINKNTEDRIWKSFQKLKENMPVIVASPKSVTIPMADNVEAKDARIEQAATGVLSDIAIGFSGLSEQDFEDTINNPSGYSVFSEFKVGQYQYESAIYRMVIRKNSIASNPLIYGYKVHVDIDDVKDWGTLTVPAKETKVYFHRTYYTPPDVVVNVVGGASGDVIIPTITATDGKDDSGRYFTVILKNSAGKAVTGTITWNSTGY